MMQQSSHLEGLAAHKAHNYTHPNLPQLVATSLSYCLWHLHLLGAGHLWREKVCDFPICLSSICQFSARLFRWCGRGMWWLPFSATCLRHS